MKKTAVFLLLPITLLCGCIATQSSIKDVHHQLNVFNEKLEQINENQASLSARMDTLSSDLMQNSENSKDANTRMSEISAKLDDLKSMTTSALEQKDSEAKIMLPTKLYSQSHAYLMQKKYERAVEGFSLYLEKYPDAEFTESAMYYLGNAY